MCLTQRHWGISWRDAVQFGQKHKYTYTHIYIYVYTSQQVPTSTGVEADNKYKKPRTCPGINNIQCITSYVHAYQWQQLYCLLYMYLYTHMYAAKFPSQHRPQHVWGHIHWHTCCTECRVGRLLPTLCRLVDKQQELQRAHGYANPSLYALRILMYPLINLKLSQIDGPMWQWSNSVATITILWQTISCRVEHLHASK